MTVLTESRRQFLHRLAGVSAWVVGLPSMMAQAKALDQVTIDRNKAGMADIKWADLNREPGSADEVVPLSTVEDGRKVEVILLRANTVLRLEPNIRNDIYVLKGQMFEQTKVYPTGTFFTRCVATHLTAGSKGTMLLIYRDQFDFEASNETLLPTDLEWYPGGAEGMEVAPLIESGHQLMLVAWDPGTQIGFHTHPRGEEIFVLGGELQDQHGRYPAGTWQRLYPGTSHAPYAKIKTLILLRNGHLHG